MRKEPTGYAVIEFNHSGIPDNELKPEEFTPRQEAVLRALQKDRQAQIRRGCPVSVIDMATGDRIESFNMKNVAPSEFQKNQLGRAVYEAVHRFMQDPENAKKFEEWKKQRQRDGSTPKK